MMIIDQQLFLIKNYYFVSYCKNNLICFLMKKPFVVRDRSMSSLPSRQLSITDLIT